MKKRLIAWALALVMLFALSACGGSDSGKEEPSGEPAAQEQDTETEDAEAEAEATADEDAEAAGETAEPKAPALSWKPDSPVTVLVPYETGNINDVAVRVLAQYVEKYLGQVVYVENVAGESPAAGWAEMLNRDADGLTIGVIDLPAFNRSIMSGLQPYGTASFDMICSHVTEADLVVVRKSDNRFRSLDDLAEYGQAHQGELIAATNGEKGANHIAAQAFAKSAQFTYGVNHQDSTANELQALRDEAADFCVVTVSDIVERDSDLRVLGVFSKERVEAYPDVPTLGELGYFDGELGVYRCIVAPAGVSDEVVSSYEAAFQQTLAEPEYLEASAGITTQFRSGADTVKLVRSQQAFLRSVNDAFWTIDVPAAEEEAPAEG